MYPYKRNEIIMPAYITLYFVTLLSLISARPPWIHPGKLDNHEVHQMLQEVMPAITNNKCNIVYRGKEVIPGEKLNHTLIAWQPEVSWTAYNDTYYTLYVAGVWLKRPKYLQHGSRFTTPYGARPEVLEWDHWVVFNIPGCNVGKGEVLARYMPPREGLDEELYIFMVFEQPGELDADTVLFKDRTMLDCSLNRIDKSKPMVTKIFAQMNNLTGPIAANYFINKPAIEPPQMLADHTPLTVKNFTKQYNMTGPICANFFVKLQYPLKAHDSDEDLSV